MDPVSTVVVGRMGISRQLWNRPSVEHSMRRMDRSYRRHLVRIGLFSVGVWAVMPHTSDAQTALINTKAVTLSLIHI